MSHQVCRLHNLHGGKQAPKDIIPIWETEQCKTLLWTLPATLQKTVEGNSEEYGYRPKFLGNNSQAMHCLT